MEEELLESMRGGISDRVIDAMTKVKRDLFVPVSHREMAYADIPLAIGHGQTISAPHMVAIMCDLLDIQKGVKVLDVGTGSGYHAAVMAELTGPEGHVYSVEIIPELVKQAQENLSAAGVKNVTVVQGDGGLGLPEYAPYDRINVAAAAPAIPEPLKEQLKKGGKMVVPVGDYYQELVLVTKENGTTEERKMGVAFVPLVGKHGF